MIVSSKDQMKNIRAIADEYLLIAQENFGEMCSDWSFVGIEINEMNPHLRYYPEDGHVAISLSKKIINDEMQLHFQLAHEVCHLLYPTGAREATTVLNEGLSTYFSVFAAGHFCTQEILIDNLKQHNPNYFRAMMLVHALLEINRDAIKLLRDIEPQLNRISFEDFEQAKVAAPQELINNLLAVFE